LAAILTLSLIGGIAVANESTNQANQSNQAATFQPNLEKAKDLIGAKVIDRNGTRLGTIEDIVLTPQRDGISYVALSYGGTMGIGSKLLAVPWSAFEVRPQEQGKLTVVLNADESYLKTAQGFDKNHWPVAADQNWPQATGARNVPGEQPRSNVSQGTAPTVGGNQTPQTMTANEIKYLRVSQLIGTTVKNSEGTDIGKLDNVVLDLNSGKVAYGILSVDRSFLGTSGKLAAIPWSAIRIDPRQGTAMLNVDKQTLQAIAFDRDHFPNLADPQYSRELYQRFNARPYWEALGFVPGEQHVTPPQTSTPGVPSDEHNPSVGGMNEPMGY
jgi:sporulation protein YlmC with PRC-barrel domain